MKKIASLLLILLFQSCSDFTSTPEMWKDMYKDYKMRTMIRDVSVRTYEPVGVKEFAIENSDIRIEYVPDIADAGTSFNFINKTNSLIKIIWDEVVLVDHLGSSRAVFHSGVKISDRASPKTPSLIIPNGSLSDDIISIDSPEFYSGLAGSGWIYEPLCGVKIITTHELDDSSCKGKIFTYFITYELNNIKKNVTVKFKYIKGEPRVEKNIIKQ